MIGQPLPTFATELSERQREILKLLEGSKAKMTSTSLAERYEVSSRMIRYDLDDLDYYLHKYGLCLKRNRDDGITIQGSDHQKLILFEQLRTSRGQLDFPYLLAMEFFLHHSVTVLELAAKFQVSKNKIIQALPAFQQLLAKVNLALEKRPAIGMSLQGEENQIRMGIFQLNSSTHYDLQDYLLEQFSLTDRHLMIQLIKEYQQLTKIQFSDKGFKELTLSLCYQQLRLSQGHVISYPYDEMKQAGLGEELTSIMEIFKNQGISLPVEEALFMLKQIRNTQVIYLPKSKMQIAHDSAYLLTQEFIRHASYQLGIDLSLNKRVLELHLNVALHRLQSGQTIENPLTEQVRYRYRFIFETVKKIMLQLEVRNGINFPDEEIAYLTMHVGACFEMNSQPGHRPRALIICHSGLATSTLLATRLKIMLPEIKTIGPIGVSELNNQLVTQVDLVISTVEVPLEVKEFIVVNPLLDLEDLVSLKRRIFTITNRKQLTHLIQKEGNEVKIAISDILAPTRIQLQQNVTTWRKGIRLAAEPLVKEAFVTTQYIKAMIQAVETLGPYMVFIPQIAIVHASPQRGVLKEGISLLTLSEPVVLGETDSVYVSCFIVLATLKKESQLFLSLMKLLDCQSTIQTLMTSRSKQEILQLSDSLFTA